MGVVVRWYESSPTAFAIGGFFSGGASAALGGAQYAYDAVGGFTHGVAAFVAELFGWDGRGQTVYGNEGAFQYARAAGKAAATVADAAVTAAGAAAALAAASGPGAPPWPALVQLGPAP